MAAPEGNDYWKARSTHGRQPVFATPEALWDAAVEYFEWVTANPIETTFYRGKVFEKPVTINRPMTNKGLCIFLGIDSSAWQRYKAKEGFCTITTRVNDVIFTQKFEGAAVGLFEANLIARELGLADKTQLGGDPDNPLPTSIVVECVSPAKRS